MSAIYVLQQLIARMPDSIVVHMSPNDQSSLERWAPTYTAIAAVALASGVQWRIATSQLRQQADALKKQLDAQRDAIERQIAASVRSTARLRWLERIRVLVARMIGAAGEMYILRSGVDIVPQPSLEQRKDISQVEAKLRVRFLTAGSMLRLYLNPDKEEQATLLRAVQAYQTKVGEMPFNVLTTGDQWSREVGELRNKLEEASIAVLKLHWKRASKGE
jgi:hypothetical protein